MRPQHLGLILAILPLIVTTVGCPDDTAARRPVAAKVVKSPTAGTNVTGGIGTGLPSAGPGGSASPSSGPTSTPTPRGTCPPGETGPCGGAGGQELPAVTPSPTPSPTPTDAQVDPVPTAFQAPTPTPFVAPTPGPSGP